MRTRQTHAPKTPSPYLAFRHDTGERGAVLVHVAIALVALLAFSGLVVDYGILWLARRQAQNSADAGAMAGAVSLAFVNQDDYVLARQSAISASMQNHIWLDTPDITDADVQVPYPCPPGSPGAPDPACIRVDVFRNQRPNGKPLETIFGRLFGVMDQGVKATATAEILYGTSASCVRPWAVADKYKENQTGPWDPTDTFHRYDDGVVMPGTVDPNGPADYYEKPGPVGDSLLLPPSALGTGFVNGDINNGGDYGKQFTIKQGDPHDTLNPGWYYPVVICGTGGNRYEEAISGACSCDVTITPPVVLDMEPGNMIGPTKHGVDDLLAQDPDAQWQDDPDGAGPLKGGVVGGCTDTNSCNTTSGLSPRIVPIPIFNPDTYDFQDPNGRSTVEIVKMVGFFIEGVNNQSDVTGRICDYPTEPTAGTQPPKGSSFLVSIALVR